MESCKEATETPQPVLPIPTNPCAPSFDSGYSEKLSYMPGEKMKAFIHSNSNTDPCRLDVYDLQGNVAFSVRANLKIQNISNSDPAINGFGYSFATEIEIPTSTKSGLYQIERKIPFIVKTTKPVDITIVYPSNTDNAYALAGGRSLYSNKASIVSFHRPMELQWQAITGLKWFSTLSNLSVNYIADIDLDDYASIQNSKIIALVGHSEYWTRKARKNFDRFVEEGKHAIILSGNTMWWQVRYTLQHQMICYKSNNANSEKDPIADPLLNTIEWDHPSLQFSILSSIGADFPHGGYGLQPDQGWDGYKIVSPQSPLLEGLNLSKGDIISLPSGEYDGAPISSFTPDGYPQIDNSKLNFHRIELIGFDKGARGGKETIGTFIVFQKSATSGIVVNGASYDWCSHRGMGGKDGDKIKKITLNAISKLLNKQNVFSN
ncbi:MAG: hypothetical protein HYZ44_00925 [Bacteroidetes bacterium]|nr:hypothetical protein [Bacteroidota bacterium]